MTTEEDKKIPSKEGIVVGVGFLGNVDAGKCLGYGTPVLMANGRIVPIEDVWIDDYMAGDDNTPRKVTAVTMGKSQLYKISLGRNGGEYVVNDSHILSFRQTTIETIATDNNRKSWMCRWWEGIKIKSRRFPWGDDQEAAYMKAVEFMNTEVKKIPGYTPGRTVVDMTVDAYLSLPKQVQLNLYGFKVPYHFPEVDISLDPYIMGVWLGDGTSAKPQITNIDTEVITAFEDYIETLGLHLERHGTKYGYYASGSDAGRKNPLTNLLRKYNVLNNKHIPPEYKYNCPEVQRQLLAGLIDTDGSYEKGTFYFSQKDLVMVQDVQFIARSLGFWTSIGDKWNEKYKTMYYQVSIVGPLDQIPTKILRKKAHPRISKVGYDVAHIKVTPMGEGKFYGVTLEGNNKRFLLGDFTVTHNSSCIGALFTGKNDNGNGLMRAEVSRHPHEIKSGKTSDVTYLNRTFGKNKITFVDLAGHEKYLKTTIYGLGAFLPDVVVICVDKFAATYKMTKEHIGLAIRMQIPFIIAMTKTDLYDKEIHDQSINGLGFLIRKSSSRKLYEVKTITDLDTALQGMYSLSLVPVVRISSVTRSGFDLLTGFLENIHPVKQKLFKHPGRFMIDRDYRVVGIGLVVCGYNGGDPIKLGDKMYVDGSTEVVVRSIHDDYRNSVSTLPSGVRGCLALRTDVKRIRPGTVLSLEPVPLIQEVIAEVEILTSHSTTITEGYQTVIHCGTVRRTASIVTNEDVVFRGGKKGPLRFRFIQPVYLEEGQAIFFREGRVIGDGVITKVFPVEIKV